MRPLNEPEQMASTKEKVDTKEESKTTKPSSEQASNVKKPQKPKQSAAKAKDASKKGPGKKAIAAMQETLKKLKDDEEKLRLEEEEKIRKLEEAEEAKKLQAQREKERKEKKKQRDKERKEKLKAEGKYLSAKQKFDKARARTLLESLQKGVQILDISEPVRSKKNEDDDDSSASDSERNENDESQKENDVIQTRKHTHHSEDKEEDYVLRAAIVCVLGHVDTGKTKILDKLRRTNVQDSEAGGITQQIGATNVPVKAIKEQVRIVKEMAKVELKVPGLLIIDTPGHESFSNLRNRGSSLCDIAILVVDIMHGLEPQTIESISILKSKKTPFVVALNKIDRLYNWNTVVRKDVRDIVQLQEKNTILEFEKRSKEVIVQFAEQGLNAALFYDNPDPRTYVSLVPTSAITGEGMGNLLALIMEYCQNMLYKRLLFNEELQATVLEVKAIPGLGTTIDVILVNGYLREGETMILAGTEGPIVTQIRSLLMPQPLKELRVKNAYIDYKEIKAAQGVKIAAKDLDKAIAGINLRIASKAEDIEACKEEVSKELHSALSTIKVQDRGVFVQASTLGSLEALVEFLRTSDIPYCSIRVGPVVKKDVMKASAMLEHEAQYAVILAFDVKIEKDAQELADNVGVKIFQADIIYHLFDKFTAYREELKQKKREEFKDVAVFPCKMRIMPQFVFNSRDPIVCGVMIEAGIVKVGTPICVPTKEFINVGIITSIESNHKPVETARKGQEVCIKIENVPGETPKLFGRHFDETDLLVSKISRQSIDACKNYFRDDLVKADWQLMVELKKTFEIL